MKKQLTNQIYILSAIVLLNSLAYLVGVTIINKILLLLTLIYLILIPLNSSYYTILFLLPNMGLYSSIGFEYIFNFSIIIYTIKIFVSKKVNLNIQLIICLFFLIILELLNILKYNGNIEIAKLFSLCSWSTSYLFIITILKEFKSFDYKIAYKFFSYGCIFSIICAWCIAWNRFNGNIPMEFRFIGLLKDPNYYSLICLILIFCPLFISKMGKTKYMYILIFSLFGFMSVSKMFMFMYFCFWLIYICLKIIKNPKFNLNSIVKIIIILIPIYLGIVYLLIKLDLINVLFEKYRYRFDSYDLTTGRTDLWLYFLKNIFHTIPGSLFGYSLTYYTSIFRASLDIGMRMDFLAHNTYLDIFLSWGAIGGLLYIFFIYKIYNRISFFCGNPKKFLLNYLPLLIVLVAIFALSLLEADMFIIILSFVFWTTNQRNSDITII